MHLTKVIFALGLMAATSATPLPLEEKRQQGAPQAVSSIVNTLVTGVNTNIVTINGLVQTIDKNVGVTATLVAAVNANLDAISAAFNQATLNLVATTTGAVGGVGAIAQQYAANQAAQLDADVRAIAALVQQISITASLVATNLTPAALTAVNGELVAVQNAVKPFITPLQVLVEAVRLAQASAAVNINGVGKAASGLIGIVNNGITRTFSRFI